MTEAERDLCWDAMVTFADRINGSDRVQELEVVVYRHLVFHRLATVEGLWVGDSGTDVYQPVRRRSWFGGSYREIQSVEQATANIGRFLRVRPDLGGDESHPNGR